MITIRMIQTIRILTCVAAAALRRVTVILIAAQEVSES